MASRSFAGVAILTLTASMLGAQERCDSSSVAPVHAGSEWERFLRAAQVLGKVSSEPWSLRPFSPRQARALMPRDSSLPWSRPFGRARCRGRGRVQLLQARFQLIHNSAFPFGWNDGATWAGRGLTAVAEAGVSGNAGPFTLTIAPVVFSAENARVVLAPNGQTGDLAFADWRHPTNVDLPQRFGASRYSAFDLGQSELRVDVAHVALGLSTSNEYWGPATEHPIVLGNNAAGFPRIFFGTSNPVGLRRFGKVHARVFYGRLEESRYSVMRDSLETRLASGIAATIQPSFLPGLELGAGRFFHVLRQGLALDAADLAQPFGGFFNVNQALDKPSNQLGTVFSRLVLPNSGVEIYGEFGREDYNWDLKEFWQFLDHDSAYLIGGAKVWQRDATLYDLRAEVLNSRTTHLALSSPQVPMYVHATVRQGHTQLGQALGSIGGYGGGASLLRLNRYRLRERVSVSWERVQLADLRQGVNPPNLRLNDVAHVWRANRRSLGHRLDLEVGVAAVYEINRHRPGNDAFGLQTTVAVMPGTFAHR